MTAQDNIVIGVVIFILAITFFLTHFLMSNLYSNLLNVTAVNQSSQAVQVLHSGQNMLSIFDSIIFTVFIGMVIGTIITGWYIAGNPLFVFVYFLVWVFSIISAAYLSNLWETTTLMSIFGMTIQAFPKTNLLIGNLPYVIAVTGFLGIVVIFAKPAFANQGNGGGSLEY